MAKTQELIDNVLKAYGEGMGIHTIKKMYNTSSDTIYDILNEHVTPELKAKHMELANERIKSDKKEVSIEKIIDDFRNRMLAKDMASKYGVHIDTIRKRVQDYEKETGIKLEEILSDVYKKRKKDIPIEEIVSEWKSGKGTRIIAKKYDVGPASILDRLHEYEEKTGQKLERNLKKQIPMESVIEDLKNGMYLKDIAEKYGVSEDILYVRRREYEQETGNIIEDILNQVGTTLNKRKKADIPVEEMIKLWQEGETYDQLAKKYGVARETVFIRKKEYEQKLGEKLKRNKETRGRKPKKISNTGDNKSDNQNKIRMGIIWREYIEGLSIVNLALKYKMSEPVMRKKIHQYRALLMTKSYVDLNKSIAEIARETNLSISEVKENIKNVLRKEVTTVPIEWYLRQKTKGYTEERILKEYILLQRVKKKINETKNVEEAEHGDG